MRGSCHLCNSKRHTARGLILAPPSALGSLIDLHKHVLQLPHSFNV
jgi:hypothetical protein